MASALMIVIQVMIGPILKIITVCGTHQYNAICDRLAYYAN